jgi:hypothetical protein
LVLMFATSAGIAAQRVIQLAAIRFVQIASRCILGVGAERSPPFGEQVISVSLQERLQARCCLSTRIQLVDPSSLPFDSFQSLLRTRSGDERLEDVGPQPRISSKSAPFVSDPVK